MATTAKTANETTADRLREVNDRFFDSARKAGGAYLAAYEKSVDPVVGYQERFATDSEIEWVSTLVDAQARFARELTKTYVSTGREFLKA